jgi:hypothetical protein
METKTKMYTVITFNSTRKILMFVELTLCQFEKYFSKDVTKVLSQKGLLQLPETGKIGKISIAKMTLGSTECLVVNLTSRSFNNRFSGGKFTVFTKHPGTLGDPNENVSIIEPQPKTVITKLSSMKVLKNEPQSEKTDTGCSTKRKSTKTRVIPFPTNCIFSYNYSMIIRLNHQNPPNSFYLSNVG